MTKINIVTHCWAGKYKHYAAALQYQLDSLMLNSLRQSDISVTLCCDPSDELTMTVAQHFLFSGLEFRVCYLDPPRLGRRSIGRNAAALATDADIVWFTDVDHVFGKRCLDELARLEWPSGATMIFPKKIKIHQDHVTGDKALDFDVRSSESRYIDPSEFIDKGYNRAIGGVQIVKGGFAREHGYLNNESKWQRPRSDGKPFGDFRDDIAYRKFCLKHGRIVPVDLPGVYRLRHSTTTYQGPK